MGGRRPVSPKVTERSVAGTVQALCKRCASTMQDLCKQVPFACKLGQEPQPNLCVFTISTTSKLRPSTLIIILIRVTLKNVVQKQRSRTCDLLLEFYHAPPPRARCHGLPRPASPPDSPAWEVPAIQGSQLNVNLGFAPACRGPKGAQGAPRSP